MNHGNSTGVIQPKIPGLTALLHVRMMALREASIHKPQVRILDSDRDDFGDICGGAGRFHHVPVLYHLGDAGRPAAVFVAQRFSGDGCLSLRSAQLLDALLGWHTLRDV